MTQRHQLQLIPKVYRNSAFGGQYQIGKRKIARPLSTRKPMHVVIKSDRFLFGRNLKLQRLNLLNMALCFSIKVYEFQFNGNHLHLVMQIHHRDLYIKFIRALTGRMAAIAGIKNAFPLRPFTRIVEWGRALQSLKNYIHLNELESVGIERTSARRLLQLFSEEPPH